MSESEFLDTVEATLNDIETRLEGGAADIEITRAGNVLTLEFEDGAKAVVNSQAAMQELWLAAKSGGFHFRLERGAWRDTRSGADFYATLSRIATTHSDVTVTLAAPAAR